MVPGRLLSPAGCAAHLPRGPHPESGVLSQTFQTPDDFEVHAYLEGEFADQPLVHAKLRFTAEGAHIALSERSIWEALEENPDGSVDVTLSAPGPALAGFHFAEFCDPGHGAGTARTA